MSNQTGYFTTTKAEMKKLERLKASKPETNIMNKTQFWKFLINKAVETIEDEKNNI